jgi:hypothetical protein
MRLLDRLPPQMLTPVLFPALWQRRQSALKFLSYLCASAQSDEARSRMIEKKKLWIMFTNHRRGHRPDSREKKEKRLGKRLRRKLRQEKWAADNGRTATVRAVSTRDGKIIAIEKAQARAATVRAVTPHHVKIQKEKARAATVRDARAATTRAASTHDAKIRKEKARSATLRAVSTHQINIKATQKAQARTRLFLLIFLNRE